MRQIWLGSAASWLGSTQEFAGTRAGRDRVSCGAVLEQFDNDSLFGLGRRGARATAPGCPDSEAGRGRAAVVSEPRIGTGAQEGLDSSRAPVPDSSMQWCHTARGGCAGISARLDEIANDIPAGMPGSSLPSRGMPVTAACNGSAPRRFLARTPAPRVIRSRAISGS